MKLLDINELDSNWRKGLFKNTANETFLYYGDLDISFENEEIGRTGKSAAREIFVVLEGCGLLKYNDEVLAVKRGSVIIVEPGESLKLSSDKTDILITLWCSQAR
ncbi:MAG TPA: hypothetical protein PK830_10065 [Candidatus Atribacteria bacterium]|nr:hypothetical protein [Candidatus Atribacteria bacterium]HPT79426.1 hypothetical protein [Candidatus Atribacteria bacterium]